MDRSSKERELVEEYLKEAQQQLAEQVAAADQLCEQARVHVRELVQRRTRGFISSANIAAREQTGALLERLSSVLAEEAELQDRVNEHHQLQSSNDMLDRQITANEQLAKDLEPRLAERRTELEALRESTNAFHQETVRTISSLKDRLSAFEEEKMEDYRRVLQDEVARLKANPVY